MTEPVNIAPEAVEAIARRVAELLREEPVPVASARRLVSAAELAEHLGVTRGTVYDHADELGARRLTNGRAARLRFDLEEAVSAWGRSCAGSSHQTREAPANAGNAQAPRRRSPRSSARLLPVRGPGADARRQMDTNESEAA